MNKNGIIERLESWGKLIYDTNKHRFMLTENEKKNSIPYIEIRPLVLNIDLTFKCNLNCKHCVAKDMEKKIKKDLIVTDKMIDWINTSDFMVLVITGGEPLLSEKEETLINLISKIKNKGIIIDTNGTIIPSKRVLETILNHNILLRVSLDSINYLDDCNFRKILSRKEKLSKKDIFTSKINNIRQFKKKKINLAIQSVLYKQNMQSILDMPNFLSKHKIKDWYVQRFILSYKIKDEIISGKRKGDTIFLENSDYQNTIKEIIIKCNKMGINCFAKMEKRHNSVFLLVGNGEIYTQGEIPGQKIRVGDIYNKIRYFDYVSSSEHSVRYYGSYWQIDNKNKKINNKGIKGE